jgi:hypothetical protein
MEWECGKISRKHLFRLGEEAIVECKEHDFEVFQRKQEPLLEL